MLVELELPYTDVRAGDLSLTLGAEPEPALEVLSVDMAGWRLELRLLGCSHQALVDEGVELSETVACRPGVPGFLPAWQVGGATSGRYAFAARVQFLDPGAYSRRAADLLDRAAAHRDCLAGVFPAVPAAAGAAAGAGGPAAGAELPAFTALELRARSRGVSWATWHGYPQTGELVMTESRLERAP